MGTTPESETLLPDLPAVRPQPLALVPPLDGFDAWWAVYPRKTAKDAARKAYRAALKRATVEELLAGAERYRDDPHRTPQFTAYPATWLNGGRWGDEPLPSAGPPPRAPLAPQDEHFRGGGGFFQ